MINYPSPEQIEQLYAFSGSSDMSPYIQQATQGIEALGTAKKGRAVEEAGLTGEMRSGTLQKSLGNITQQTIASEADVVGQMLAERAKLDYEKKQADEERQRITDAEEEKKKQSQNMNIGDIIGEIIGATIGIPGGPAGMALGANLGGKLGSTIGGQGAGATSTVGSGMGDILGYLSKQDEAKNKPKNPWDDLYNPKPAPPEDLQSDLIGVDWSK